MCFYPISEFIYRMFCNNISKLKPQFQSLSHGGTKSAEVYGVSRFTAHSPPWCVEKQRIAAPLHILDKSFFIESDSIYNKSCIFAVVTVWSPCPFHLPEWH